MSTPEETDHKLEDLREAQRITRRRASDPTPSAPSLQSVAEGAARECASILAPFNYYADRQDEAALEFTSVLTRHFAPLLTAREAETRDWIKWHGELQEKLQDAQAQLPEDVRAFIERVTIVLQQHADPDKAHERTQMFQWAYRLYTQYKVEKRAARKEGQQAHENGEGT